MEKDNILKSYTPYEDELTPIRVELLFFLMPTLTWITEKEQQRIFEFFTLTSDPMT